MSYEGLRLPRQLAVAETVPSLQLRTGNLSAYSAPFYAPGSNVPFANNQIPLTMISPIALIPTGRGTAR